MAWLRGLRAGVLCLSCLGGCALSPQDRFPPDGGAAGLPPRVALDQTPFFPQTDYQCGPAALATVLQAQGIAATPAGLAPQVYLPGRKGSLQVEMTAAARRRGALPYVLEPTFHALLAELAGGNPVLVLQNLGLAMLPRWHYAVVTGYDIDRQVLVLRSGTQRQRQSSFAVFRRTWARADNWALVVVTAGSMPATATPAAYLAAAQGFEAVDMPGEAKAAYRAATQRWPARAEGWLMSGTLAYAMQRFGQAVAELTRATRLAPDDTRAWNNLAYALRADGCAAQAAVAIQCALQQAPDNHNLVDSARELAKDTRWPPQRDGCETPRCPLAPVTWIQRRTGTVSPATRR